MNGIKQLGEGVWVLHEAHAIVSAVDTDRFNQERQVGAINKVPVEGGSVEVKFWGRNNLLPQEREEMVLENNIVGPLLRAKRNLALGSGLVPYRERFVEGEMVKEFIEMPREVADWMRKSNFPAYLRTAAKNLVFHANVFTEVVRSRDGKIASVKALECRHVRAGKKNAAGEVKTYYWCGNWQRAGKSDKGEKWPVYEIPAYDPDLVQPKFMLHTGDDFLGDGYYHIPAWWGGRHWVTLANVIPLFHLNNLKHGYVVRWHIEVPKDYFFDYTQAQQTPDKRGEIQAAADAAEADFLARMNGFLAGLENTGRAVFSKYEINRAMGKEFPGIKIHPLNFDMKDEALLTLFEKSNQAVISGQGIHPTLANVETAGKLSSGSEIRNAYLFYLAIMTPAERGILAEIVDFISQDNGWDATLKWWFRDIEMTKLDENPNGQNPTVMQ